MSRLWLLNEARLDRLAARIAEVHGTLAPEAGLIGLLRRSGARQRIEALVAGSGPVEPQDGIAEISIAGILADDSWPDWWWYGHDGYGAIEARVQAALADDRVEAILLKINSPGGVVSGAWALAETVFNGSARAGGKPIWAVAEMADSAGYWIGSAADRLFVTATGEAGSIGVITTHVDISKMLEMFGETVTHIFAGAHKADGSMYQPLSDSAKAAIQAEIDATYDAFVAAVARNRSLAPAAVKATQALVFIGQAAVDAGLADAVMHPGEARAALLAELRGARQSPAPAMAGPTTRQKRSKTMSKKDARVRRCGEALGNTLDRLIDQVAADRDQTREDIIAEMADAAGIEVSTVNQIIAGEINCPPIERLQGFADVLDVDVATLTSAAEDDGCDYSSDSADAAKADPEAAPQDDPVAADRARVRAILALPEADGRAELAQAAALEGLDVEAARRILAAAPKTAPGASALLAALDATPEPNVGPDVDDAGDEDDEAKAASAILAAYAKTGLGG